MAWDAWYVEGEKEDLYDRVELRLATDLERTPNILKRVAIGIRVAVPGPIRHRGQRDALMMERWKGLQPGEVGREGEIAIT